MAGSSFTIPIDLSDQVSLKRLLIDLAATLDVTTGVVVEEGTESLVTIQEAIDSLGREVKNASKSVSENTAAIASLSKLVEAQQYVLKHEQVDPLVYRDFDDPAWGTIKGNAQFQALGTILVNAPFVPVPAGFYVFYTSSVETNAGGMAQRLLVEEQAPGSSLLSFYRTGKSFGEAITNGWTAT